MVIHHTLSVIPPIQIWFTGINGQYISAGFFLGEASNPFMHFRQLVMLKGLRETFLSEVVENLYFFVFIVCRTVFAVPYIANLLQCDSMPYFIKFCCLALLL